MQKTRGRPKAFNENEALTSAMNYFWEHGYDNTSLDNLLNVMGIKKSSFYSTFKSKEKIFSRCLALYRHNMLLRLKTLKRELGAKETLLMLTKMTIQELQDTGKVKGCLVVNSGQECYNKHTHLSEQISLEFNFFQNIFLQFVDEAKSIGEIKNSKTSKVIANRYMNTLNGLIVSIQAGINQEQIDDIVESLNEILE
jgi:AcrR family transcriptional regulator